MLAQLPVAHVYKRYLVKRNISNHTTKLFLLFSLTYCNTDGQANNNLDLHNVGAGESQSLANHQILREIFFWNFSQVVVHEHAALSTRVIQNPPHYRRKQKPALDFLAA